MTDQIEDYIMKSHETEQRPPKDERVKEKNLTDAQLYLTEKWMASDVYAEKCKQLKTKPDTCVHRQLEKRHLPDVVELDCTSSYFTQVSLAGLMALCECLPNLTTLNLSSSGLKNEMMDELVGMAQEHKTLTSISLKDNSMLGFGAAKKLLPLLKSNRNLIELDVEGTNMAAPTRELISKVLQQSRQLMESKKAMEPPASEKALDTSADDGPPVEQDMFLESYSSPEGAQAEAAEGGGESPQGGPRQRSEKGFLKADAPDPSALPSGQRQINFKLKGELLEHEQRLLSWFSELLGKAESRPKEFRERTNKGIGLMDDFQQQWKWPVASDYTIRQLEADIQLHVTQNDLEQLYKHYTPQDKFHDVGTKPLLQELGAVNTGRRRKAKLMDDVITRITGHGPGLKFVVDIMGELYDLMHLNSSSMTVLKTMLDETDEQAGDLKNKIDRAELNKARAVVDEDFSLVETYFEEGLQYMEKHLDLTNYRLKNLLNKGSRSNLLGNLKKYCQQADDQMNETKSINDDLMHRIEDDYKLIDKKMADEHELKKTRDEDFQTMCNRTHDWLIDNSKKQQKVWTDIAYSFKEMKELGEKRYAEIDNWIKDVEKHERRKVEFNMCIDICQRHTHELEDLMNDCHITDELLKQFDEFIRQASTTITDQADNISAEGDQLALNEQKHLLESFKRFYLWLGEFLYKKEKRLEELDRQIRNTEFQINFAMETLDPEINMYKDQLKELCKKREEVHAKVDDLRERGDRRAEEFKPHEEALRASGMEFISPILELQEENLKRRQGALAKRRDFHEKDKIELVDREEENLNQLDNITKQARKTGIHSLVHPLSPTQAGSPSQQAQAQKAAEGGSRPGSSQQIATEDGSIVRQLPAPSQ
eukprot:TRINITY_DN60519_c0_g1_i1.p1 TRINITY_DN60519_c0_g1~~TRINITY_DN60519_c0_g1_i1.p1  ORF type:complete len:879 (-),score=131.15 TRINITY_DN60519_c0_g1_i1:209-2845(-)